MEIVVKQIGSKMVSSSDSGQSVAAIEAQLREVAEKKAASLSALRVLATQVPFMSRDFAKLSFYVFETS